MPSPLGSELELSGLVRRGWVPEPVRRLAAPVSLAALLGPGLPRGRLSEVVGALGSGRTSLLLALLAAATAAHEVTALVDVSNSFNPLTARHARVDLTSILWVRPPSLRQGMHCAELILSAGGFGLVALDLEGVSLRHMRHHSWPRLARAAERSGAALVVLAPQRLAGSFAALDIAVTRRRVLWSRGTGVALLDGFEVRAEVVRSKLGPPGAAADLRMELSMNADASP